MKTGRVKGAAQLGVVPRNWSGLPHGVPQPDLANAATPGVQRIVAQVKDLQQALAASRHEASAARRQVVLLEEANARLRQLVGQREEEIAHVRHFAYHDELTGLPNRALLLDRLNQALVRARRQQTSLALLLLDLDGFKAVNDALGHAAGDTLLKRVAERLLACTRGGDTVCRYGGDEFVLLLPEVDDEKHALAAAQKIHARLAKPYRVDDRSITVTASIGVAVYPDDGVSHGALIDRADFAMYRAKTVRNSLNEKTGIALPR